MAAWCGVPTPPTSVSTRCRSPTPRSSPAGARLPASVLWIDGAQSGLWARLNARPDEFDERMAAYPDLRIEHVDDAGHNVHHDQPERLAALIEAFMA